MPRRLGDGMPGGGRWAPDDGLGRRTLDERGAAADRAFSLRLATLEKCDVSSHMAFDPAYSMLNALWHSAPAK